jgi:hypothetical protein
LKELARDNSGRIRKQRQRIQRNKERKSKGGSPKDDDNLNPKT